MQKTAKDYNNALTGQTFVSIVLVEKQTGAFPTRSYDTSNTQYDELEKQTDSDCSSPPPRQSKLSDAVVSPALYLYSVTFFVTLVLKSHCTSTHAKEQSPFPPVAVLDDRLLTEVACSSGSRNMSLDRVAC